MMPVQPGEKLLAVAMSHNGIELGRVEGTNVKSLMSKIDDIAPTAWAACVVGEYTSDGTHWGKGKGRVLASREPRRLDNGRFYKGWIVE